jgi:hypothetical protein
MSDIKECKCSVINEIVCALHAEPLTTYHGISKAICLNCGKVTQDITALEILNDLDPFCTACNMHAVAWHTQGEIVVTAQADPDQETARYTILENKDGSAMKCQLCAEVITDINKGAIVLPWGETCEKCLDDIKEYGKSRILVDEKHLDPALNCECGYGH